MAYEKILSSELNDASRPVSTIAIIQRSRDYPAADGRDDDFGIKKEFDPVEFGWAGIRGRGGSRVLADPGFCLVCLRRTCIEAS